MLGRKLAPELGSWSRSVMDLVDSRTLARAAVTPILASTTLVAATSEALEQEMGLVASPNPTLVQTRDVGSSPRRRNPRLSQVVDSLRVE